jgi:hypothetical protein
MLAEEANSGSLTRVNREPIGNAEALDSPQRAVPDTAVLDIVVGGGLSTPAPERCPNSS